ncbi:PspC domain-containing protein [Pseudoalteromonas sp. SR44-5]|uniref:PspC domain-containing protein n=1 Tax=Pseudoalteromonas rhizosphaerae TaxID=2518973 RepID=A0ABW8KS30_9GAMM|nr:MULTISPECIES: PspC domain-containing protein [Pseudoalteromonas]MBB1334717.1 PspC domain-containing protein [Pseudoalteromonas sp. SR41-6]MBB1343863.1 PspC domain-containing protein [Pseudoalteromonas sp. SR45-6]MBB1366967.1 PspC domain-containing protein [Pseudoalteromonas sp. SR44-5]MBB1419506.1 PspC domain-containing protein [Pseudoalteromonas sp. SG44-1]MBB1424141.1 PspC domain-containing protein [Pseudoalteromonas sp. SG43-7]
MNTFNNNTQWCKDPLNKKISGVCSGLARRFDFPIWATRLATIVLFIQFPLFIGAGYLIAHCCLDNKVY